LHKIEQRMLLLESDQNDAAANGRRSR
jgi:hypothetical protein